MAEEQQGQPQGRTGNKRMPLVFLPDNRDGSTAKDAKLVNCYVESGQTKGDYHVYKRAGYILGSLPSGGAAAGLGVYNWLGDVYSIFGTNLYKNGVYLGTVDATNGVYRFTQTLGTPTRLVMGNGVKAYTYDGTTFAVISDADFPATFCKGWAYLDETTYVLRPDAGIQGSALNDPTSWDPLNVLIAQIEPDGGVAMAKQLVYTIALKQWSGEAFYDAANATGSPLSTVQGAKINYGCVHADSVQDLDGALFWISNNRAASPQVVMMDGLKAEVVSSKAIDKLIDELAFSTIFSFVYKESGHKFYILTIKASNLTLVFDITERAWHQWTDTNGNYFPFVANTFDSSGNEIWQHETDGGLYYPDTDQYSDNGSPIIVDIVTPNFDGGTSKRKLLNQLFFVADQCEGTMQVRCSDDDYKTWSNWRNVDLRSKRPYLDRCGSFYKRAYNFRYTGNTAFRISAAEPQLAVGTM